MLAFLPLVPGVDPEKAGWAMPPRVVAASQSPAMLVLMASLMTLAAVVMARARLRPSSVGSPGRVAVLGFAWFVAATAIVSSSATATRGTRAWPWPPGA
jgi:hypothetical protein